MNLKAIRQGLGKTEEDLDKFFGFDSGTIYALENGNLKLDLDTLDQMEEKGRGLFSFDWLRKEAFKQAAKPKAGNSDRSEKMKEAWAKKREAELEAATNPTVTV